MFLGTPEAAVAPLRALHENHYDVALVVTQPDKRRGRGAALSPSPVKAAALELGLPVSHRVDDVIETGAELGVVVAFGKLIKAPVLAAVPMVNMHFSLLPRWRGAAPVERALLAGDTETGVSLMELEAGLDTGPVLGRRVVAIGADQTAAELRQVLTATGTDLLLEQLRDGLAAGVAQVGETTYAAKIDPAELLLDWNQTADHLHRVVRVGRAWTTFRGRRLGVLRSAVAGVAAGADPLAPGQIRATVVGTGDGALELLEVQPEGRAAMAASAWVNGARPGRRRAARVMTSSRARSRSAPRRPGGGSDRVPPVASARALALRATMELEHTGGRANLIVPALLAGSGLEERDRAFVTELVYGTTRMRRACDWLVDRHLRRPVEPDVRAALRLGAYQLAFLGTPPHAAVSATVAEVSGPAKGLVNAVLRRVAEHVAAGPPAWPSDAVRLSYPDWVVAELDVALGPDDARAALEQMNAAAQATMRVDGYTQDRASQWAAEAVMADLAPEERLADLCAAPGGKATWLARGRPGAVPALVVAGDLDDQRAAVVAENVTRMGLDNVATLVFDGTRPPFPSSCFDRVLVDAPCSGLGVLRRRPDARWRIHAGDVPRLADLQRRLLDQALTLVRPGGLVVYSVCTLTLAETSGIDEWLAAAHPEAMAVAPAVGGAWQPFGRGARLLPQTAGTDGMFVLALRP